MKLRQYKLKAGSEVIVAWLEDARAKIGDSVTLKDNGDTEKRWKIIESYRTIDGSNLHDQHESGKTFASTEGRATKKEQRKK